MAPCLVDLVAIYLSVVQFPKNILFTNMVVVSLFSSTIVSAMTSFYLHMLQ